jgi:2-dehydropantoate 2-reductase
LLTALAQPRSRHPVESEIRNDIWIKLTGNAAFNPLSALTRSTMAETCNCPDTRAVAVAVMNECLEVAAALGSRPDISIERRPEGAARIGSHKTSMLHDLEAGLASSLGEGLRGPLTFLRAAAAAEAA